jgi:hypothetical protein
MGIITSVGWLFSGAFKFIPGVPTVAVYGLAILAVIGLPAGYGYHKGSEGKAAAVVRCEAACKIRVAEKETTLQRTLSGILEANAKDVEPEPKSAAEQDALCKKSPFCIEGN